MPRVQSAQAGVVEAAGEVAGEVTGEVEVEMEEDASDRGGYMKREVWMMHMTNPDL